MTLMHDTPSIDRVDVVDGVLSVWVDGASSPLELSPRWVRDHSEDEASFDPFTKQRSVDTFQIAEDLSIASVEIVDSGLLITWAGGEPSSELSHELLASLTPRSARSDQSYWRNPTELSLDIVPFEQLDQDIGMQRWLESIRRLGFGLVSGAPTEQEDAGALARRIGYVRHTVFGGLWTLSSEVVEHADSAYGNETLEPHTDGSYSHDGPGMQFFLCAERTGTGGESVLVDGFAAASKLREQDPKAFELLSEVAVPAHYIEDGVHLVAKRPTLRLDEAGDLLQVTFNNYDRSPFLLPEPKMSEWYAAYSAFHELLVDESSWWKWRLEPGQALIFDNWRCLHGRMGYTGKRVFHGGYLNHEDLESALRLH